MTGNFWRYRVVKTARKAFWLPYARLRAALDGGKNPPRSGRTAYGVSMIQCWDDRTFVYCHGGIYGRFLADFLERRTEPFVFVDIGANQGLYSLIAAKNPACAGVMSFEPVARTYALLCRNLELNDAAEMSVAHRLAISDTPGRLRIRVPAGHSGMASLGNDAAAHNASFDEEIIEAVAAAGLGPLLAGDLPIVVKVDVEGHEATVIRELLACSASPRIEAVFYEIDTRWSQADSISAMLREAGFTHARKVGTGHHFDVLAQR